MELPYGYNNSMKKLDKFDLLQIGMKNYSYFENYKNL